MSPDLLRKWGESAEILIAADSGADRLLAAGQSPDYTVGDFDSISEDGLKSSSELCRDEDQSYTDCDKVLRFASRLGLLPLTLACVEGDRLDHVLGTVHSVIKSGEASRVSLALRRGMAWVVGPGRHVRQSSGGRPVSLIPLERTTVVSTKGLKWELDNVVMGFGSFASISNQAESSSFEVCVETGTTLIVAELSEDEVPVW